MVRGDELEKKMMKANKRIIIINISVKLFTTIFKYDYKKIYKKLKTFMNFTAQLSILKSNEFTVVKPQYLLNWPNLKGINNIVIEINTFADIQILNKFKNIKYLTLFINPNLIDPYQWMDDEIQEINLETENIPDRFISTFILNHCDIISSRSNPYRFAFILKDTNALYGYATIVFENSHIWITGEDIFLPSSIISLTKCAGTKNVFIPSNRESTRFNIPHPITQWLSQFDVNIIPYDLEPAIIGTTNRVDGVRLLSQGITSIENINMLDIIRLKSPIINLDLDIKN